MREGSKFSNSPEEFEKIINFLGKMQTGAVVRVREGTKFSNSPEEFEKVIKLLVEKQT